MDIERIKNGNTKYLAKNVVYYSEIGSTQDEIRKLAENNVTGGTLVITDNQTSGHGTKGRTWNVEGGKNITMSFVIYPDCEISKLEGLTIKIAEAIVEAIDELYGYKLSIKEPNDIIINDKKISGILTQSTTISEKVNYILIGIGFNVNQTEFPLELENIATSLKNEYGKIFKREDIIVEILEKLENKIADIL